MNWLAHAFLSKDTIEYQLGNILADPLKGKPWEGAHALFREGIEMHLSIDSFTDANPLVRQSKARLKERGYLRGVVIDLTYDHLLLKNWERYASVDIDTFVEGFYRNASEVIPAYPDKARGVIERLITNRTFVSYKSFEGLEAALKRIDMRLSPRLLEKERASEYAPLLKREMDAIEEDFNRFFPELLSHFKSQADLEGAHTWLR